MLVAAALAVCGSAGAAAVASAFACGVLPRSPGRGLRRPLLCGSRCPAATSSARTRSRLTPRRRPSAARFLGSYCWYSFTIAALRILAAVGGTSAASSASALAGRSGYAAAMSVVEGVRRTDQCDPVLLRRLAEHLRRDLPPIWRRLAQVPPGGPEDALLRPGRRAQDQRTGRDIKSDSVRQLAREEADPAGMQLAALVANPDGHGPIKEQERLVVAAVDVNWRGVAPASVHVDDGELASGDREVEDHGHFPAPDPAEPLMLVHLADVRQRSTRP